MDNPELTWRDLLDFSFSASGRNPFARDSEAILFRIAKSKKRPPLSDLLQNLTYILALMRSNFRAKLDDVNAQLSVYYKHT